MPTVTQSRSLPGQTVVGQWYTNGVPQATELTLGNRAGTQTTTSFRGSEESDYESLSGTDLRKNLRREYVRQYDTGHSFFTQRKDWTWPINNATIEHRPLGSNTVHLYVGDLRPNGITMSPWPNEGQPRFVPNASSINADGRLLISMTVPSKSEASLANFLGELKERLPALVGIQTYREGLSGRSAGSESLNVEFGLKPMKSDIEKFAIAAADAMKIIKQYARDSGKDKQIRRKAHLKQKVVHDDFGIETTKWNLPRRNLISTESTVLNSSSAPTYVMDKTTNDVWFSGAYSYHLAEAHSFLGKIERYEQQVNHLLGTRITADTIYQLTPWSWLFDWFGDFGTFVRNVSLLQTDSTVLRYGYVMHKTVQERIKTVPRIIYSSDGVKGNMSSSYSVGTMVTKQRTRATPYGFGLSTGSFTSRQWAILGALGLSRSPGTLR